MLRGPWRDLAWILPMLFAVVVLLPLAWSPEDGTSAKNLVPFWFLFGAWAGGIAIAGVIARKAAKNRKVRKNVDH